MIDLRIPEDRPDLIEAARPDPPFPFHIIPLAAVFDGVLIAFFWWLL